MSAHRFRFLAERDPTGVWRLRDPDEIQHLVKVLRLDVGTDVEATDGAGRWMIGTVARIEGTRGVEFSVREEGQTPAAKVRLVLMLGALKHGAVDELLPSLVELGLNELHLFSQPGAEKSRLSPKAVDRWHRIATQALKQCKRDFALTLAVHEDVRAAALMTAADATTKLLLLPGAAVAFIDAVATALRAPAARCITIAVGSEQGWSEAELKSLQEQGFVGTHAGTGILRAVTAALTATSVAALLRG